MNMDGFADFIKDCFGLDNTTKAELIKKELLNINPLCAESPSAFFSTLLKFQRVAADTTSDIAIEKMLDIFYQANFSYIQDPKVKEIFSLIKSYTKPKIYHTKCLDDMEKLLNLTEDNSEDIISKWLPDNIDDDMKPQNVLNMMHNLEILSKIHAAICALREIAYMRQTANGESDVMMQLQRITRIVMYSNGQMLKLENLIHNPIIQNFIAAAKGSENINKRWEPLNNLKKEAIEVANELWSKGDKKLHNNLAKDIYKIIRQNHQNTINTIAEDLSRNVRASSPSDRQKQVEIIAEKYFTNIIRKAIIPVAEKFNRVRGTKGKKK